MEPIIIGTAACVISFAAGVFCGDKFQWIQKGSEFLRNYMSK